MDTWISFQRPRYVVGMLGLLGAITCGCSEPPECDCDAAITKLGPETLTAGQDGMYQLQVHYSGHELCDDGKLCVEDAFPPQLSCDPNDPAYQPQSSVNTDWDCTCNGMSVKCCYNKPLPATVGFLPPISVPVEVSPKATKTVSNCATILTDFPGSFEDNTEENNESCTKATVRDCPPYSTVKTSGVEDYFVTAAPVESPSPSQDLLNSAGGIAVRNYDASHLDQWFAHTFTGLDPKPGYEICGATLRLGLSCRGKNDEMSLRFTGPSGFDPSQIWYSPVNGVDPGVVCVEDMLMDPKDPPSPLAVAGMLTLDLGSLPVANGATNLLPGLSTYGFLDVTVQDDTAVDFLELTVDYCCTGKGDTKE